jgi:hypothetical protein
VLILTGVAHRPALAASQRRVPALRRNVASMRSSALRSINQGFTRVHPSDLPLACGSRMQRQRLGLYPRASHPALAGDARRGGDRSSSTSLKQRSMSSTEPPIQRCSLDACDLASHATMQKCDSRRRDGLVRSEPVVSRCAKRHLGAAASRRSSSPPSDGASYCTSSEGEQIFGALAASAFARRAAWSRPVRRRPGKQGGRRAAAAASPGGSRSPQHGRTDCSLSLRAAVSGMSSVTVALTQERSPRGRADGSIHLLLAWKRKRDRAAIAREDAGAALLRAFQISALASRGPTARHCRNRRKDGMGTTAFPSWCGQRGLIGSSDDDRGDRNSACAPS